MAITSLAVFKSALDDLVISGVGTTYEGPPDTLNTADLPAKWVDISDVDEQPWTADGGGGWPRLTLSIMIAYGPIGQGLDGIQNFADTITAMDNTLDALRGLDVSKSKPSWNLRRVAITVGGVAYWGLEVEITGAG